LLFAAGCREQPHQQTVAASVIAQFDTSQYTAISWQDTVVSFGEIREGDSLRANFRFTNSGSKPLFITDVRTSCGCTVAEYPKDAIAPGSSGMIRTVFGTAWHPGTQVKIIMVKSNTRPKTNSKLVLRGQVIPKPK
ncbi:MAG: DUF1573 domain-containing protein, partial [Chitinophagaceae bacterium]|nr:DUF1573 domain-containing protein [Chitinophagaceae bacterium]